MNHDKQGKKGFRFFKAKYQQMIHIQRYSKPKHGSTYEPKVKLIEKINKYVIPHQSFSELLCN